MRIKFICLLWAILAFPNFSISQCLVGTYTIGGTSPDYINFSSAVADLNLNGVCGQVIFNVRPGIYNEQITINEITGASSVNNIIFQSQTLDSNSVILQFPSSSSASNNFVLKLNGTDFITFRYLTIERTGSLPYGRVVELALSATNNEFSYNIIRGVQTSSISTNAALIFSGITVDDYNTLWFNHFYRGSYGLYLSASVSDYEMENDIKFNKFLYQSVSSIYLNYQSEFRCSQNTIITDTVINTCKGIEISMTSDFCIISGNKIHSKGYGVFVSGMYNISPSSSIFENNMVYTTNFQAMSFHNCSSLDVYNNSLSSANFECIRQSGTGVLDIKNCIFYNRSGGKVASLNNSSVFSSNYNNMFTNGPIFGTIGGIDVSNLSAWQQLSAGDFNTKQSIPPFVSPYDMHILYDNLLKDQGAFSGAYNDIDFEIRGALADIGADEFPLPTYDAAAVKIHNVSNLNCPGLNTVYVALKNVGTAVLSSVQLNWTVNGVLQTPVVYNCNLQSLEVDSLVALGNYNFPSGLSSNIVFWVSQPNGQPDFGPINDTAKVTFLPTAMGGSYTIGGSSPDYVTINDAISDMYSRGICGPVIFNIRNGNYYENIVFANNVTGASEINTITFVSESGNPGQVTVYGPTVNQKHCIFDKITFNVNPSHATELVRVYGNNIKITNSILLGPSGTNSKIIVVTNDSCVFSYNHLHSSESGVYATTGTKISIIGNSFYSQNKYPIWIELYDDVLIDSNMISISPGSNEIGIRVRQTGNYSAQITRNKVSATLSIDFGILLFSLGNPQIRKPLIANNMVSLLYSGSGISCSIDSAKIIHNSILINGTGNSNIALVVAANHNFVYNNISYSAGTGIAVKYASATNLHSDYNLFYTLGNILIEKNTATFADLATFQQYDPDNDQHSISSIPNFISNTNLHIVSDPNISNSGLFFQEVSHDIDHHQRDLFTPDIGADEFSIPLTEDIDAIAITTLSNNICSLAQPIYFTFRSIGTNPLISTILKWSINGVQQTPFNWTGNLSQYDTSNAVLIGNYLFDRNFNYTIKIWSELPNGVQDMNKFNDTLVYTLNATPILIYHSPLQNQACVGQVLNFNGYSGNNCIYNWQPDSIFVDNTISNPSLTISSSTTLSYTVTDTLNNCSVTDTFNLFAISNCCLSGDYTVYGSNPDFLTLTSLMQVLEYATICGPVRFLIRSGSYNEFISIPNVSGTSSINTITFTSESQDSTSVLIHGSPPVNSSVIDVNGNNIIIDKLSVRVDSGANSSCIDISDGGSFKLRNSKITVSPQASSVDAVKLFYHTDSLLIENNYIEYTNNGIISSCSSNTPNKSTIIKKNKIIKVGSIQGGENGIHLIRNYRPIIENNSIENADQGIGLINTFGNFRIIGNKVINSFLYGIVCSNIEDPFGRGLIANNMVLTTQGDVGIVINTTDNVDIINNSILLESSSGGLYSSALVVHQTIGVRILNNILSSEMNTMCFYLFPNDSFAEINHNLYNYDGQYIGVWGVSTSIFVPDLNAFQTISNFEMNGLTGDPQFISNTDLHLGSSSSPALGTGLPIATIQFDIDGDLRDLNFPDIGADEAQADVGLSEYGLENKLFYFPNPVSGNLQLVSTSDDSEIVIELYNSNGKFIQLYSIPRGESINLSSLSSGFYFIKYDNSFYKLIKL